MQRVHVTAPPLANLRPIKHATDKAKGAGAHVPIFPDLVADLCAGVPETARYVCGVLAGWAYSDPETVSAMMVRLGLQNNRCRYIEVSNNSMLVRSFAYMVQSECGRVVLLGYRGTDPFDLSTWATDIDVHTRMVAPVRDVKPLAGSRLKGDDRIPLVHGGFYRNQRATWFDVAQGLQNAVDGASIFRDEPGGTPATGVGQNVGLPTGFGPVKALYITGHSLGASMTLLAAYRIATTPTVGQQETDTYASLQKALKAVYAFAPAMVGNPAFAEMWRADPFLGAADVRCHVYERDVVPRLPPGPTGTFEHVGKMFKSQKRENAPPWASRYEWVATGERVKQVENLAGVIAATLPIATAQLPGLGHVVNFAERLVQPVTGHLDYSFYNHLASNYVDCSQPDAVQFTEFGDDF